MSRIQSKSGVSRDLRRQWSYTKKSTNKNEEEADEEDERQNAEEEDETVELPDDCCSKHCQANWGMIRFPHLSLSIQLILGTVGGLI